MAPRVSSAFTSRISIRKLHYFTSVFTKHTRRSATDCVQGLALQLAVRSSVVTLTGVGHYYIHPDVALKTTRKLRLTMPSIRNRPSETSRNGSKQTLARSLSHGRAWQGSALARRRRKSAVAGRRQRKCELRGRQQPVDHKAFKTWTNHSNT